MRTVEFTLSFLIQIRATCETKGSLVYPVDPLHNTAGQSIPKVRKIEFPEVLRHVFDLLT